MACRRYANLDEQVARFFLVLGDIPGSGRRQNLVPQGLAFDVGPFQEFTIMIVSNI